MAFLTQRATIHLKASDAKLRGPHLETRRTGYSGGGYVTGFTKDSDEIEFRFQAKPGIYDARVRYASGGDKGYGLVVNDESIAGFFVNSGNSFSVNHAGLVELRGGENSLKIRKGWGWYDIDSVDLVPAVAPLPPSKPVGQLSDSQATLAAQKVYKRLISSYGAKAWSGQYGAADLESISKQSGRRPAIYADDLMDYSPSRVSRGSSSHAIEDALTAAMSGTTVSISWHWNAPSHLIDKMVKDPKGNEVNALWYKGFYTNASTFDLAAAVYNLDSTDGKLLLSDIDAIAVQLERLNRAGIPVLWRPLHEAEGGWFWWGAKGPEPFKRLWKLMYQRLTVAHRLHNLIWVFSSGTNPAWYPGDGYVDVVGIDAYPPSANDPLSTTWKTLRDAHPNKLIAISEFGGIPNIERMRKFGVYFDYFVSWGGSTRPETSSPARIRQMYLQPVVVTLPASTEVSHGG